LMWDPPPGGNPSPEGVCGCVNSGRQCPWPVLLTLFLIPVPFPPAWAT